MNRMERRRAEAMERIRKKEKILEENRGIEQRLRKAEEEMREEISHYYMGTMYTAFILVLHRACGYGIKRINRVLNELAAIINDLDEGTIDIADLKRKGASLRPGQGYTGLLKKYESNIKIPGKQMEHSKMDY